MPKSKMTLIRHFILITSASLASDASYKNKCTGEKNELNEQITRRKKYLASQHFIEIRLNFHSEFTVFCCLSIGFEYVICLYRGKPTSYTYIVCIANKIAKNIICEIAVNIKTQKELKLK